MLDETGFYAPSMAHNALPSRPWLGISVFHGIISTVSKPLRYSLTGSMCDARQAVTCGTYSLLKLRYFIAASVSGIDHGKDLSQCILCSSLCTKIIQNQKIIS